MPTTSEEKFDPERAQFEATMADARAALDEGNITRAVDLAVAAPYRYVKGLLGFALLRDLYKLMRDHFNESKYRETSWQGKLMAELYTIWPKVGLEHAIVKHDFPELDVTAREQLLGTLDIDEETFVSVRRQIHETKISGAEAVHVARYYTGIIAKSWGALSRGRFWLKFWDLESGEVIRADEHGLPMMASALGRDGSHVLFSQPFHNPNTGELCWSTEFRQTFRQISTGRAGDYHKSHYANVQYYKLYGEVISERRRHIVEVDRKTFEERPIKGRIIEPHRFSEEYLAMLTEEDREDIRKQNEVVRVEVPHALTIAHDEIEGYLPAQTTTFTAVDGLLEPKVTEAYLLGGRISAMVAVEDDDAWLENIVAWGYGLKGMYYLTPTSPITEVCISSDGALGFRNGHGNIFGIWNLWTGALLRTFEGHTGRVTCLNPSIDVSLVVSGSEDKTLRLWKPATVSDSENETGQLWKPLTAECVRVFEGHEDVPSKVRFSLDATRILSGDRGGIIKLWDVATGECLRTIQAHGENISGLYFMFDGRFAVSGSWDKTVKIWDLTDGSCIKTFEFSDWVTSVDMTPDGRYLLASSYEGTKVWELVWRLDTCEAAEWDERARPYLEILMNANAKWEGKLGTPVDMTAEEIKNTLRRGCPSWSAWHSPSKKNDWHRVWHLDWDVERTLGYAGYGWLSEVSLEGNALMDAWQRSSSQQ